MSEFEVPEPIVCSPFEAPTEHWHIHDEAPPELRRGRRPSVYFYPGPGGNTTADGAPVGTTIELKLVTLVRSRLAEWRKDSYPGATRTTVELLEYWQRPDREKRLFFAQIEAAETIIFLKEARPDYLQGIHVPLDEPGERQKDESGYRAFRRYACKMATGSGKTTVMALLAAWSILNKVHDRGNARYSDVVLVVCPNVTIRRRLGELDAQHGEASLYRTRDLVPAHLMPDLAQGRVLVTNWHVFEPEVMQAGGVRAKVLRTGVRKLIRDRIYIGDKTTTARGKRYLTRDEFDHQLNAGLLEVVTEELDARDSVRSYLVEAERWIESDTAVVNRVLGREVGGKQNILVFNDEAHHAYRIRREEPEDGEEEALGEAAELYFREATVWIEGLDRINKLRRINFCVDLSATPYFLGRVGQDANRPFPWVVSDFSLTDAIESGLVKIPQLAVRDASGESIPGYFNIWKWIMPQLTSAERGGRKSGPKPEAILKYANTPIAMLGGLWEQLRAEWEAHEEDPRPPVFILVCANTALARVVEAWLARNAPPPGIPTHGIKGLLNAEGRVNTIRVDSRVVEETDSGHPQSDETQWLRLILDTVGKTDWPVDRLGRPVYPEGFEALAAKRGAPLHPPGRDIRCIVSVGMLTEGWDCNTVTHIVGLRPFQSQLLCEQVVGRGLRRRTYEVGDHGRMTEEVAKVFGVPFQVVPFKANPVAAPRPPRPRHQVRALPERSHLEIRFPRVEGFLAAIRNRVTVDWNGIAPLFLDPSRIPPEVQVKASLPTNIGRPSLTGPGRLVTIDLSPFRRSQREQSLAFEMASDLTRTYVSGGAAEAPAHVLFPQLVQIVQRYIQHKVTPVKPAERVDLFLSPYYGWAIERLSEAIRPDTTRGEAPEVPRYELNREAGSSADVDFATTRDVREVLKSHVNYLVADTKRWEQSAAYILDTHPEVESFVKNAGLGFGIPYLHNGQKHEFQPDFIVRFRRNASFHLILETKGYDPLRDVKAAAAERWAAAVNSDGRFGSWAFAMAGSVEGVRDIIDRFRIDPKRKTADKD
jgi:type III restriction enzyme